MFATSLSRRSNFRLRFVLRPLSSGDPALSGCVDTLATSERPRGYVVEQRPIAFVGIDFSNAPPCSPTKQSSDAYARISCQNKSDENRLPPTRRRTYGRGGTTRANTERGNYFPGGGTMCRLHVKRVPIRAIFSSGTANGLFFFLAFGFRFGV